MEVTPPAPTLRCPGLFITGTDTGVGKTVVTCAIAAALRREASRSRVGVWKPFATGCRREREGLVSEDAEALAHFADCREPLDTINPVRFVPPLAPAVAAEEAGVPLDWTELWRSLSLLDASSDRLLVEGVGGLMVPIDPDRPTLTVLDLAKAIGFPAVVVARSVLGTLNHTAMTVRLLKDAGLRVAGVVMNGYDADVALQEDPSVATNRRWIERMTGVPVLATVPRIAGGPEAIAPGRGRIPDDVLEAVALQRWETALARSRNG